MSVREKGRKKTKQETSTQYKVTDPISMADLEHIHLRKGRSIQYLVIGIDKFVDTNNRHDVNFIDIDNFFKDLSM